MLAQLLEAAPLEQHVVAQRCRDFFFGWYRYGRFFFGYGSESFGKLRGLLLERGRVRLLRGRFCLEFLSPILPGRAAGLFSNRRNWDLLVFNL